MNGTDPAMPMLTHLTTQTQQDKTQPRHSDGFTMISPIESRRSKLHMMVQKEEENIQRSERTEQLVQRVERSDAAPVASTSASHTSPLVLCHGDAADRGEQKRRAPGQGLSMCC
ncbi:uncharacterized protein LOC118386276 isoform X2 [Oncorhynchus keta]|uniref:uncharacterized protein LOC118386276 isoform X2 n=1 Tax=Oncorhynchus keta TaxID=8018 RepID=UPI0015FDBDAA|nr:uncharacterized protein LOC118386276 isoform X2 [Oncorhynchus keta]